MESYSSYIGLGVIGEGVRNADLLVLQTGSATPDLSVFTDDGYQHRLCSGVITFLRNSKKQSYYLITAGRYMHKQGS